MLPEVEELPDVCELGVPLEVVPDDACERDEATRCNDEEKVDVRGVVATGEGGGEHSVQ